LGFVTLGLALSKKLLPGSESTSAATDTFTWWYTESLPPEIKITHEIPELEIWYHPLSYLLVQKSLELIKQVTSLSLEHT